MKYDIILAGVGGQGILSVAAVISTAAMQAGFQVRQSEVHGMAQRGGAVQAHLRMSSESIASDLIGRGSAELILSMEPMESLRYLDYLSPGATLITAAEPFVNIDDYPETDSIYQHIHAIPNSRIIETKEPARQAGSIRAANMVLIGAASTTLPIEFSAICDAAGQLFQRKGQAVIDINIAALEKGRSL